MSKKFDELKNSGAIPSEALAQMEQWRTEVRESGDMASLHETVLDDEDIMANRVLLHFVPESGAEIIIHAGKDRMGNYLITLRVDPRYYHLIGEAIVADALIHEATECTTNDNGDEEWEHPSAVYKVVRVQPIYKDETPTYLMVYAGPVTG